MVTNKRFTNEQIIEAYKSTGNIWKAGKKLGCCGQSVWERLKRLGYSNMTLKWTEEEISELKSLASQCTIGEAARRIGRTYSSTASMISKLGIGVRFGNSKRWSIKRGSGLTKASVTKHIRDIENFGGSLKAFAVQRGLYLDSLVKAIQKYDPVFWDGYVRSHSNLASMECPNCHCQFVPMSAKQKTCCRRCANQFRSDQQYFGGKRSEAVGLKEGVCQLCKKETQKLSAHHIFGKQNDPDNDYLVALCAGCHQLVTRLAAFKKCNDAEYLEDLLLLALTRHNGHLRPLGYRVIVEVEELEESDVISMVDADEYGEPERTEITVGPA